MKLYLSLIALIFVSLFIVTGYTSPKSGISSADNAPDFTVANDSTQFSLHNERGKRVLITFWSVTDAASRRDCNMYSAALAQSQVRHVAINLDRNSILYKEIMLADALPVADCYSPDAVTATKIAQDYGLDGHYGSVLVSAEGEILAINPDPSDI